MSKLDDWQAIFDEYREAQQAYLSEKQTRLTRKTLARYRNAVDNLARVDVQHIARQALKVALAAEAAINQHSCYDLRIGFLQVLEADNMHATAQEFQKHIDAMEKIEDALKEIQS